VTGFTVEQHVCCVQCRVRLSQGVYGGIHHVSASSWRGLKSLTCCSVINVLCWWIACI